MARLVIIALFLSSCATNTTGTALSEALDVVGRAVPRISLFSREQVVVYYYECKEEPGYEYEETSIDELTDDDYQLLSEE